MQRGKKRPVERRERCSGSSAPISNEWPTRELHVARAEIFRENFGALTRVIFFFHRGASINFAIFNLFREWVGGWRVVELNSLPGMDGWGGQYREY